MPVVAGDLETWRRCQIRQERQASPDPPRSSVIYGRGSLRNVWAAWLAGYLSRLYCAQGLRSLVECQEQCGSKLVVTVRVAFLQCQ